MCVGRQLPNADPDGSLGRVRNLQHCARTANRHAASRGRCVLPSRHPLASFLGVTLLLHIQSCDLELSSGTAFGKSSASLSKTTGHHIHKESPFRLVLPGMSIPLPLASEIVQNRSETQILGQVARDIVQMSHMHMSDSVHFQFKTSCQTSHYMWSCVSDSSHGRNIFQRVVVLLFRNEHSELRQRLAPFSRTALLFTRRLNVFVLYIVIALAPARSIR